VKLDQDLKDSVKKILAFLNLKDRKDIVVFSFFLVLSFFLWSLIVLNKNYTTNISYPIVYNNLPEGKELLNYPPTELIITISGKGFDLLRYEFTRFLFPYVFDVKNLFKEQYSNKLVINTHNLIPFLSKKFKSNIKILNISPNEIILEFSKVFSKKVKVIHNIRYELQPQFIVKDGIDVFPDSITITGPFSLIDTIKYVSTEFFDFKKVDKVFTRKVHLKEIGEKIKLQSKYVHITIPAYKFTENKILVPIEVVNAPEHFNFKISPNAVTVKYKVLLKDFKKVKKKNFRVIVDYNSFELNVTNEVKVILSKSSKYVFDVSVFPKKVKIFVLTK